MVRTPDTFVLPTLVNTTAKPPEDWTNLAPDLDPEVWGIKRVTIAVKRVECINCTKKFLPPVIGGGIDSRGQARFSISARKTCSEECESEWVGSGSSYSHSQRKRDRAAYAAAQTRSIDFSAMAKKAWELRHLTKEQKEERKRELRRERYRKQREFLGKSYQVRMSSRGPRKETNAN